MRNQTVFGRMQSSGGETELRFDNLRVPKANIRLGEGRGFEIAQGRLGPGRIHHCMRSVGQAQRAPQTMCRRVDNRVAFGRKLADQASLRQDVAKPFCEIEQARLLTAQSGRHDGPPQQQGGQGFDRRHQGGGAADDADGDRPRHPGPRRHGCERRRRGHLFFSRNRFLRLADGRLVCEYLREHGIPLIAGGRSADKLHSAMASNLPDIETASDAVVEVQHTVDALTALR